MSSQDEARELCAVANRILALSGLADGVTASLGHASLRLPDNPEQFLVKGRGYEVDALAMIKPQDLVLCDLQMPVKNGFEVLDELRADERLKSTPVVALTASAMMGTKTERCCKGLPHTSPSLSVFPQSGVKLPASWTAI